jgi:hypothetical protein
LSLCKKDECGKIARMLIASSRFLTLLALLVSFSASADTVRKNLEVKCTSPTSPIKVHAWFAHDFEWQMIHIKGVKHGQAFINGAMDDYYRFHSMDMAQKFKSGHEVAGIMSNENEHRMTVPGGDFELPLVDFKGSLYQPNSTNDGGTFAAVLNRRDPEDSSQMLKPVFLRCTAQYKAPTITPEQKQSLKSKVSDGRNR